MRRLQCLVNFLPHPLARQGSEFAAAADLPHEVHGFFGDGEALCFEAGRESGDAQHAQGVFGECIGDVAQCALFDVALAAVGVDEFAIGGFGDGVDGQVPALEVVFQRDFAAGIEREAAMPRRDFALQARQGVFFFAFRVQEDGEILADLGVAGIQQFPRRGTHHNPIPLPHRQPQQLIADGAAD